jgi:Flp pilus assembly protein TadG
MRSRALYRRSDERGQVAVLFAVFLAVLAGAAAMATDVGSWYRADKAAQATADAAALAGAQGLHLSTDDAEALAEEYAEKNGGGDITVSFGTRVVPNDLITVTVARPAPGYFSKIFGIEKVEVQARATARAGIPSTARGVAPIAVDERHPMLQCRCWGEPTQLSLRNLHDPGGSDAAGAFSLVNLNSLYNGGNIGAETLAEWILDGYEDELPLGVYRSAPSADFNSGHIRSAINTRLGTELLFPVYRSIVEGGSQAEYDIVAWVGFVPTSFTGGGSRGTIHGYFTQVIWHGLADESGTVPDMGVRTISLTE